jgi:1,4-alpha-glucan branching enzyme
VAKSYLSLVLHAHLPFVRHPEYEHFLEENWLFEAISETYLPLLRVFRRLEKDKINFRLTLSISPTLAVMLGDSLLQERYIRHLHLLLELADKELVRIGNDPALRPLAAMYKELYSSNLHDFIQLYEKNILKGFDYFYKKGKIELITTAATHTYLPLYDRFPEALSAQIQTAVYTHRKNFGKPPVGFWIPECGYFTGLENYLADNHIKYFFLAAHGVLFAGEKPKYGLYAPINCPNGLFAFGRDIASANSVWSSEEGYPSDYSYRDFYRDIGFDLPIEYIEPYVHPDKIRMNTGFKYFAITGKTKTKVPYVLEDAALKVREHAENFLYNRLKQVRKLEKIMDRPPIFTCSFDAELFGHWWFEGPAWLDLLIRKIANTAELDLIAPSEYISAYPHNQTNCPSFSSWGNKGYSEVWLNSSNDWLYRHTHKAIERMVELVSRFPDEKGLKQRALNQAAREVLLSQASDWPFIMRTGTAVNYAVNRVKDHIKNFTEIYESLSRGTISTEWLTKLERKNNIFPDIDYKVFKKIG